MLDAGCQDAALLPRLASSRQKPLRKKNRGWWCEDDAVQERGTNEAGEHWFARFVGWEGLAGSLVVWDVA